MANVNMISFLQHCLHLYKFTVFVHSVHAKSEIRDVVNISLLQRTGTTVIRGAAGDDKKPAAKQDWRI